MPTLVKTAVLGLVVGGLLAPLGAPEASAATARQIYRQGHYGHGYGRHYGDRPYGRGSYAGPVVAGAALGLLGAAAGAALAPRSFGDDYDVPGYPEEGPGTVYGGYGPAPYVYDGYGYGYERY